MSRCAHGTSPAKRCRNSAAVIEPGLRSRRRVDDVGVAALDQLRVVRVQRHAPDELAGALARAARSRAPRRRRWRTGRRRCRPSATTIAPVSVARSTSRSAPRSIACARQSASTSRPSASVLLTSIVMPDFARTMSPGLTARPRGMFSVAPITPDDAHRQPEPGDRADGLEHGRAARHVELHLVHLRRGLDRDAAGVERHGLADEAEQRARRRRPARSGS